MKMREVPGVSLRSQEFADGENDLKEIGNYEFKLSMVEEKKQYELNSAGLAGSGNSKPLAIGLKAMRRNSQDIT